MTVTPSVPSPSFWRRVRRSDEGSAIILVVGSMLVLAMLAMTALAFSLSGSKFARFDQDYTGSMAAAQAGVEDFISRMNREDVYGYKPDCGNPAWKGPMPAASNDCSC